MNSSSLFLSIAHGEDKKTRFKVPENMYIYRWGYRTELRIDPDFLYRYYFDEQPHTPSNLLLALYNSTVPAVTVGIHEPGHYIHDANLQYPEDDPWWNLGVYLKGVSPDPIPKPSAGTLDIFPYNILSGFNPLYLKRNAINTKLNQQGMFFRPDKDITLKSLVEQVKQLAPAGRRIDLVIWSCRTQPEKIPYSVAYPAVPVITRYYDTVLKPRYRLSQGKSGNGFPPPPPNEVPPDDYLALINKNNVVACGLGKRVIYDTPDYLWVHISPVYTEPSSRQRGLAEFLIKYLFYDILYSERKYLPKRRLLNITITSPTPFTKQQLENYRKIGFIELKDVRVSNTFERLILWPSYWEWTNLHWLILKFDLATVSSVADE